MRFVTKKRFRGLKMPARQFFDHIEVIESFLIKKNLRKASSGVMGMNFLAICKEKIGG